MAQLKDIMTELPKSTDPHAGTLLQKVGNDIKELDGNTIASAYNLSALSGRVESSVEDLQESIDNHSQLLFEIDQSKASKEYVNNAIENYTFTASYHTGSSTQDTTWEQFSAAISSGQYKKFECQVFGDAEAYLLKNMYAEVTADGVDYTFSGSVRDKNYSVKFSQLHPAGGVLEVTESAGGLSSVAHDSTLTGDGTTANPLSAITSMVLNTDVGGVDTFNEAAAFLEYSSNLFAMVSRPGSSYYVDVYMPLSEYRVGSDGYLMFKTINGTTLETWTFSKSTGRWTTAYTSLGGGSGGPSTIFETVADMQAASLNVGDVVETAGFYSAGDGGGAKYQIQSTGTANGMDLIAVAGGKIAKIILQETAYTEQIGYQVTTSKADVVPYIKQLISLGVQNIKFLRCGGAPNRTYCFRDCLDLDLSNFRNVGVNLEGADVGISSGYATYFDFKPSSANTDKVMIKIKARSTKIKNIIMIYQEGLGDSSKRSIADCIRFERDGGGNYGTSSFGANLHELVIQGFGNAIRSCGPVGAGFVWHCDVSRCAFSSNDTHLKLENQAYLFSVYDCLFNIPNSQSVYVNSPFTLMFESCNFGIGGAASTICKVAEWADTFDKVDERIGNLKFLNCQYEFEYVNGAVVSDNRHLFVDNDDKAETQFHYDNCVFIVTPLARESNYSNRLFSLGNKSSISFNNCLGSFTDVNYAGNSFLEKDFSKLYLDENRQPATKIGSIEIKHSTGIEPEHFLDSTHLPCVAKDGNSILFDNSTPLEKFQLEDGLHLLNLDDAKVYVSCSRKVREITSSLSNVVRIGNELYEYVIIDGLRWISRNLSLRTKTRNWYIFDHPEWGVFYSQSNLAEIASALPAGWRLPTTQDILTLVGDGSATRARSLQSTQYPSVWPNATNSTGFSATPSSWYHLPNTSQSQPTWGMYWSSSTESGGGRHNIWLRENAIARGGWSASDAAGLKVPVRVCADA